MSVELCNDDVPCPVGNLCCTADACCYGLKGVTSTGVKAQNKFVLAVLILSIIWLIVYCFVFYYFKKLVDNYKKKPVSSTVPDTVPDDGQDSEEATNAALLFPQDIKLKVYPLKRR